MRQTLRLLTFFMIATAVLYCAQLWMFRGPFTAVTAGSSTEFLLSAVAQCEAAVLGIVVTITLVAAQLSASAYVPRAIVLFSRSSCLWPLVLIYTLSMSLSVLLLRASPQNPAVRETLLTLSFSSFPAALLTLIPYTTRTLRALDPQLVVEQLVGRLPDAKRILRSNRYPSKRQRAQLEKLLAPIEDLTSSSVRRGDFSTSEFALSRLTGRMLEATRLIRSARLRSSRNALEFLISCIAKHLTRPGRTLAEADAASCSNLMSSLCGIVCSLFKAGSTEAPGLLKAVSSIAHHAETLGHQGCVLHGLQCLSEAIGQLSYLGCRRVQPDGSIDGLAYSHAVIAVVDHLIPLGEAGSRHWGLSFALDYATHLLKAGEIYTNKRPPRALEELALFPHSEPVMRILISLDHSLVMAFLNSDSGLTSYVGEPILKTRVLDKLEKVGRSSFSKGFCASSELSDFGRAASAISNITAAASLTCSDRFLNDASEILVNLAALNQERVRDRVHHTLTQHFLLSQLDLSRFEAAVYRKLL